MMLNIAGQDALTASLALNRQPEILLVLGWRSAKSEVEAAAAFRRDPASVRLMIGQRVFLEALCGDAIPVDANLPALVSALATNPSINPAMLALYARYAP